MRIPVRSLVARTYDFLPDRGGTGDPDASGNPCVPFAFPALSDIDGRGVFVSFIVSAWITLLAAGTVALLQTYAEQHSCCRLLKLIRICRRLGEALFDVQLVTALAILIAALAQLDTISIYHQDVVMSYFLITVCAFSMMVATQRKVVVDPVESAVDGTSARAGDGPRSVQYKTYIRIFLVVGDCVMGLTYVIISTLQEAELIRTTNFCELYPIGIPWGVNTFYEVTETILIASQIGKISANFGDQLDHSLPRVVLKRYRAILSRARDATGGCTLPPTSAWRDLRLVLYENESRRGIILFKVLRQSMVFTLELLRFLVFLIVFQLIPLWYSDQGYMLCENIGNFVFLTLETVYIIIQRLAVKPYIRGEDNTMGFGQVLPLMMLLLLFLNVFPTVEGGFDKESLLPLVCYGELEEAPPRPSDGQSRCQRAEHAIPGEEESRPGKTDDIDVSDDGLELADGTIAALIAIVDDSQLEPNGLRRSRTWS